MRVVRLALIAVLTVTVATACGDDGGSGDEGAASERGFCATAVDIYNSTEPQTEAEPEDVLAVFERLQDSAPPEIEDETRLIRDFMAVFLGVEEATDETPGDQTVAAAEATVRSYLQDECGIPVTTAPTTTTPAAA